MINGLVLGVIFFGLLLMLLGLTNSAWQAAGGVAEMVGEALMSGEAGAVPVQLAGLAAEGQPAGLPPTLTPFRPVTSTPGPTATVTVPAQPPGELAQVPVTGPTETPTLEPTPTLSPTPTERPIGAPDRIIIERIGLDAPVVPIARMELRLGEDVFEHWNPPAFFAAGWHEGSTFLAEPGNTVLSGHHNIYGSVFARLVELQQEDRVTVMAGEHSYHYVVTQVMLFEERYVPVEQRIENARWILPSEEERLTLVTCWPPESNTYRLIVVAVPVE